MMASLNAVPCCSSVRPAQPLRCSSSFAAGSGHSFRTGSPVLRTSTVAQQSRRPLRQVTRMGLFGLGAPELLLVAGAAALLFGPAKIPELGQALGKTAKSVKEAANEFQKELQTGDEGGDATTSSGSSGQKLKEHPEAGEGADVKSIE